MSIKEKFKNLFKSKETKQSQEINNLENQNLDNNSSNLEIEIVSNDHEILESFDNELQSVEQNSFEENNFGDNLVKVVSNENIEFDNNESANSEKQNTIPSDSILEKFDQQEENQDEETLESINESIILNEEELNKNFQTSLNLIMNNIHDSNKEKANHYSTKNKNKTEVSWDDFFGSRVIQSTESKENTLDEGSLNNDENQGFIQEEIVDKRLEEIYSKTRINTDDLVYMIERKQYDNGKNWYLQTEIKLESDDFDKFKNLISIEPTFGENKKWINQILPKLTYLNLSNTRLVSIKNNVFNQAPIKFLKLPDSLQIIEHSSLSKLKLEDLDLSNTNLTKIENFAFANNKLRTLKLPKTLKFIGANAFYSSNLENLNLEDLTQLREISVYAFYNTKMDNVVLPNQTIKTYPSSFAQNSSKFIEIRKTDINCFVNDGILKIDATVTKIDLPNSIINNIRELDLSNMNKLLDFPINYINLENIQILRLNEHSLKYLFKDNLNNCKSIPKKSFKHLEILDLSKVKIETFDYVNIFWKITLNKLVMPTTLKTIKSFVFWQANINYLDMISSSLNTIEQFAFKDANIKTIESQNNIPNIQDDYLR